MNVLLADDHWAYRAGIKHVLNKLAEDVIIVEATDFDTTLEIADRQGDFDLVLLDLRMPGMESFAGLAAVCGKFPNTPVVVVSMIEGRRNVLRAIELGAAGYIPKTYTADEIESALRLVLNGGVAVVRSLIGGPDVSPAQFGGQPDTGEGPASSIRTLTPRQRDVFRQLGGGKSNAEIALELGIAENTVRVHVSAVLKALNVSSRTQAALIAASHFPGTPEDAP